jgi:LysM repeat protein
MFRYRLARSLFFVALVGSVFGVVGMLIKRDSDIRTDTLYHMQVTIAIETAIAGRLFEATRTAEASLPQYREIKLGDGEKLLDVATKFHTTIDVLRMANQLLPTVDFGSGEMIVVPEGVQSLVPPRWFETIQAQPNDTLDTLANRYDVTLELLQLDNPILAGRELLPGDVVFIPHLLAK